MPDYPEIITINVPTIPTIVTVGTPGLPGPPGPPGPPGAPITLTLTAGQDLSGHRIVVATPAGAMYADPTNPTHADAIIGLTTGAALAGTTATIITTGDITEPSWNWTPGQPLFVVANGLLSHTPPLSGWVQMVAVALTATRIKLIDRPTIFLTT